MKFWASKLACAFCAALLAAGLSSCGGGGAEFYPLKAGGQTVFGAAKSPSEVAVFITKKPDFPYDELGMVVYETSPNFADEPAVYEKLREKAAEIGADGIIIMNSQTSFEQRPGAIILDWSYMPVQTENSVSRIKYRAMAIRRR